MNNAAQALHNAARRYCYDQYQHWCDVSAATPHDDSAGSYRYSAKQKNVFPRYNMLNAIRVAVETVGPEELHDFAQTQHMLDSLGETADDVFTRDPLDDIARKAQNEERAKFSAFVCSLNQQAVWEYDALPYQRVLTDSESCAVWKELGDKWGVERGLYWFPLTPTSKPHVSAFDATQFNKAIPVHAIVRLLKSKEITRVWELHEGGDPEFVQDTAGINPFYTGSEGFWSSPGTEWLMYASHESTMTIAGSLLEWVKTIWPRWPEHEIKPLW